MILDPRDTAPGFCYPASMLSPKHLISALAISILGCGASPPPDTTVGATDGLDASSPTPTPDDTTASNAFTARIFTAVAKKAQGNVFLSPTSLRLALGMAYAGAAGKTAEEMATALDVDADPAKAAASARAEIAAWRALGGQDVELSVSSHLFGDRSVRFENAFLTLTRDGFGAPLEAVDFKGAAEPARARINAVVAQETHDKIRDLLPAGSVDALTRLVLTNAVYFKGQWTTKFDKESTRPEPFYAAGAEPPISAPTMHKTAQFKHGAADGVNLVELPYGKGDIAMVIVLPDARDGLPAVVAGLSDKSFVTWRSALVSDKDLALSLPAFEMSFGGSMKGTLESLGMRQAFSDSADLSKMAKGEKLSVSDVFHKTYVKVDESGTEAAAATGVVIGTRSIRLGDTLKVDHPFLFYLQDTKTGRVLFIGQVTSPAAK